MRVTSMATSLTPIRCTSVTSARVNAYSVYSVTSAAAALTPIRCLHKTSAASCLSINLDSTELTLTSSVTILAQTVLLLGSNVFLRRNDTPVLVKDERRLGKTTGGLVSSSVPHLGARTFQHFICMSVHVVLAIITAVATFHHFTKSLVIIYH